MLNLSSRSLWKIRLLQLSLMKSKLLSLQLGAITCHIKREPTTLRAMLIWLSRFKMLNHPKSLSQITDRLEILKWAWLIQQELFLRHLQILMMLELSRKFHQQSQWSSRAILKPSEEDMSVKLPPRSLQRVQILRKLMLWKNQWMLLTLQPSFLPRQLIRLEQKSIWTSTIVRSIKFFTVKDLVLQAHMVLLGSMGMVQLKSIRNWM